LAGFEVAIIGRIWVATEGEREHHGNVLHQDGCGGCEIRNDEAGEQYSGSVRSLNGHLSDSKREPQRRIFCGELS
jgi:hypothetical protein